MIEGEKKLTRLALLREFIKELNKKRKGKYEVYLSGKEADNSSGLMCNPLTREWIEREFVAGKGQVFELSSELLVKGGWTLVEF